MLFMKTNRTQTCSNINMFHAINKTNSQDYIAQGCAFKPKKSYDK